MLACNTITDFPDEIIEKILFILASIAPAHARLRDVVRFICTCRYLFVNYLYIIYYIRPITIENKLFKFRGKGKLNLRNWNYICTHPLSVTDRIPLLNIVSTSLVIPWFYGSKVSYLRGISPSVTSFNSAIAKNLDKFRCLTSLGVSSDNADILQFILHCQSLRHFKWLITYNKNSLNRDYTTLRDQVDGFVPEYKLETFVISSDKPIVESLVPKFLFRQLNPHEYFLLDEIRELERKHLFGLLQFGQILYQLLDKFRTSLHLIELHKFDGALIFNESHDFTTYNYHFPALKLLLIDSTSLLKLSFWIKTFQKSNLALRNQKPCFITINDSISGRLLTTSPLPRKVFPANWSHLNSPSEQIVHLKTHLNIK